MNRRQALVAIGMPALQSIGRPVNGAAGVPASPEAIAYPPVLAGIPLAFPADHGAHPSFRTEWWYLTAWLDTPTESLGAQLTFFRVRTGLAKANPSRFAPRQFLFAHAAIASRDTGLRFSQSAARAGIGDARYSTEDTRVALGRWSLVRSAGDTYEALVRTRAFEFELHADTPGPPVLQGRGGYSQKGPDPRQASYYYSRPGLRIRGRVRRHGDDPTPVTGTGWLDHEWSSELLAANAVGWDWVGLNLDDGSAIMAFRMRTVDGTLYATGRRMRVDGSRSTDFIPRFVVRRRWRSPRTGVEYPVAISLYVGERRLDLEPLLDAQELDTRASTGTRYWEGAVTVAEAGKTIGRGYLELTGYGEPIRF
ncbi:MAG: lipocalin-like domain-containing protein [Burkholderiaceae bacterium]